MNFSKSKELFEEAQKHIPGGVNSPVRAFKSVVGTPVFIKRGEGSKMYDVDGNEFIDYIGSWGPHLFGHNPDFIKSNILKAIENGTSFGTPTEIEIEIAKLIKELVPSVEQVRMTNSGTEATMASVRTARGYTGKEKLIKFEGCFHGHADHFLIKAGSGALTFGVPTSPGVNKGNAQDTLTAEYNNLESVKKLVEENKDNVAAIMIEPIAGNMGVVPAKKEFLQGLRELCDKENIVLIFDEVMSGFRVSSGGAQKLYDIKPDISAFGKVIGGGMPVGAFGGKEKIMQQISPVGPVYQAGTLSGNPIAMTAGYSALKHIKDNPDVYDKLEESSAKLEEGFKQNLKELGLNYAMNRVGSMMCMFFTDKEVTNSAGATSSDTEKYGKYFFEMLTRGIHLAPAQFEALFMSTAHTDADIEKTIKAHYESLQIVG
jgi:glutamate-1-semialdehyde 2,1-aminomutase